jgi:hypothetical protein
MEETVPKTVDIIIAGGTFPFSGPLLILFPPISSLSPISPSIN